MNNDYPYQEIVNLFFILQLLINKVLIYFLQNRNGRIKPIKKTTWSQFSTKFLPVSSIALETKKLYKILELKLKTLDRIYFSQSGMDISITILKRSSEVKSFCSNSIIN